MRDESIIAGIKNHEEQSIRYVMEKYTKLLWTVASAVLSNVGSDQDIEECVADVFIALWKNPEKYDPQRGSLKSWLCIVTRSRAIDYYRILSRNRTLSINDIMLISRMNVLDYVIAEEERQDLADAINALADYEKDILIRRYYYEQKPRQIAVAMDMSVKQIDNCLYRSKQKLRSAVLRRKETVNE